MKKIYLALLLFVVFAIRPTISYDPALATIIVAAPIPAPAPSPSSSVLLTHKQQIWKSYLEWCESRGNPHLKHLDTNGFFSYGSWQFQLATFLKYAEQYGILPPNSTEENARSKIMDYDTQSLLVSYMIRDGLQDNWYTCEHIMQ